MRYYICDFRGATAVWAGRDDLDAEALKETYDFISDVLKILIPVFTPLIWSFFNDRFGWRSKVKRDADAYQMLCTLAGDDPTEKQIQVLAVLKYRAFDIAKRSMRHNRRVGQVLVVITGLNVGIGVLGIFDAIDSGKNEWIHGAFTALWAPLLALYIVVLLWYYLDITRAIDAIGYEIDFENDELNKRVDEQEALHKDLLETYQLIKEAYKKRMGESQDTAKLDGSYDFKGD